MYIRAVKRPSYSKDLIYITWWLSSKESPCNVGDLGSIPGLGRPPGVEHVNTLQ